MYRCPTTRPDNMDSSEGYRDLQNGSGSVPLEPFLKDQDSPEDDVIAFSVGKELVPGLSHQLRIEVSTAPQQRFIEKVLGPFAEGTLEPYGDGKLETLLRTFDELSGNIPVEKLSENPLPLAPPQLHGQGQT